MIFAKQSGKRNKYFFSYTQGFFFKKNYHSLIPVDVYAENHRLQAMIVVVFYYHSSSILSYK